MEASYETLEQAEKGISIEECIEKANKYIQESGICLFTTTLQSMAMTKKQSRQ